MAMSHQREDRLKPLLDAVPPGFVVDTPWLRARGIDPKSIHGYVARGWLERLVRGVYRRPLPENVAESGVSWEAVLVSLQRLMRYDVHLGGESALDLAGYAHYLTFRRGGRIHLYGDVPSWLKRLPMPERMVLCRCKLFGDDSIGITETSSPPGDGGPAVELWRWPVRSSSPERAILEALDELPGHASFDHLDKIFEGLVSLRPKLLMTLLTACRSVKVRRLFFVFADRHGHSWRKRLDAGRVALGSGPRALVKGGTFHPAYHTTVPAFLVPPRLAPEDGDA